MKFFTKKEMLIILILGPVLVFVISMGNTSFIYWLPFAQFLPEWLQYRSIIDVLNEGAFFITAGFVIGLFIIVILRFIKI